MNTLAARFFTLGCAQECVTENFFEQATDASNLNRIIHEVSSRQDACIQMTLDLQANFERLHHVLQGNVFFHSGLEEQVLLLRVIVSRYLP